MDKALALIDVEKPSFQLAAVSIAFNPTFWNIVARLEYSTHFLTKASGSARRGCYALALTIFTLGLLRDHLYQRALAEQPGWAPMNNLFVQFLGALLVLQGGVLVLSSMWALGVTGTYLGDYFGILMDDIVTAFPFSVTANPMYYGSFISFVGTSLWYGKPAGLVLSVQVLVCYLIALRFEEPFTAEIYAKRERERAAAATPTASTASTATRTRAKRSSARKVE